MSDDHDDIADPRLRATALLLRRTLQDVAEAVGRDQEPVGVADEPMRRPRRDGRRLLARVAAAVVLVGGVVAVTMTGLNRSQGDGSAASSPTVQTTPPGADARHPVYVAGVAWDPTQLVNPSPETSMAIAAATEVVTGTCMERQGFSYVPRPVDVVDEPFDPRPSDDDLRDHGYVPRPVPEESGAWDDFMSQTEDPAWQEALVGGPTTNVGGCNAEALGALYGPDLIAVPPRNDEFLATLDDYFVAIDGKETDPAISEVFADWAACMSARSYDAEDPGTLIDDYLDADRLNGAPPTEAEIVTALDDYSCRDAVNYTNRYWGRLQQLTSDFERTHQELVDSMRTWRAQVDQRARAILVGEARNTTPGSGENS